MSSEPIFNVKIEEQIKTNENIKYFHNLENELKTKLAEVTAKKDALNKRQYELTNKEKTKQKLSSKKRKPESNDISDLKEELHFYKSVFKTHWNSLICQVTIKTIDGKKIWIDHIRDDKKLIESLDRDKEIEEWLKPVKCER